MSEPIDLLVALLGSLVDVAGWRTQHERETAAAGLSRLSSLLGAEPGDLAEQLAAWRYAAPSSPPVPDP